MLRTDNQLRFSEYQNLYDAVVPKDNILRKINEAIDFSFVNEMLRKSYCEAFGRPAKEPEMMFKIMFLKRMYDMSDEVLVDNLGYNMAFKYFIDLRQRIIQSTQACSQNSGRRGLQRTFWKKCCGKP